MVGLSPQCYIPSFVEIDLSVPEKILKGAYNTKALLVKMPINLEPHDIFGSNFVYLCILTLSSRWYEKM